MAEEQITYEQKKALYGIPFTMTISTADNSLVEKTFTLASSDFDWDGNDVDETAPFKDKMLYITGIKIITETGVTLDYFQVDGKAVIGNKAEAADTFKNSIGLLLAGTLDLSGASEGQASKTKLERFFGVKFMPVRWKMGVKARVSAAGVGIQALLQGIVVDNKE